MSERERIVAWLRMSAAMHLVVSEGRISAATVAFLEDQATGLEELADAIERGDHLAEGESR